MAKNKEEAMVQEFHEDAPRGICGGAYSSIEIEARQVPEYFGSPYLHTDCIHLPRSFSLQSLRRDHPPKNHRSDPGRNIHRDPHILHQSRRHQLEL